MLNRKIEETLSVVVASLLITLTVSGSLVSRPPSVVRQGEVKLEPLTAVFSLSMAMVEVLPVAAERRRIRGDEVARKSAQGDLGISLLRGANKGYRARDRPSKGETHQLYRCVFFMI